STANTMAPIWEVIPAPVPSLRTLPIAEAVPMTSAIAAMNPIAENAKSVPDANNPPAASMCVMTVIAGPFSILPQLGVTATGVGSPVICGVKSMAATIQVPSLFSTVSGYTIDASANCVV